MQSKTRKLTVTAIFGAIATVLMFLEFSVPLMPEFLKFDFSELPALLISFSAGPLWGAAVCLLKNLLHLPVTATSGVGELANFLVSICFVLPAGYIYQHKKDRQGALLGAITGTILMAAISFPVNYFITYPFYANFMSMDAILHMYKLILPAADTLWKALLIFNVPFTLVKGLVSTGLTFLIYKRLSPVLKGRS